MCTEMSETRKFFIRDLNGKPVEVEGVPITIPSLPEWKFFAWEWNGFWFPSEVRSGCRFPAECHGESLEEAIALVRKFCEKRGREQCEKVFMVPIQKYGELPVIDPPTAAVTALTSAVSAAATAIQNAVAQITNSEDPAVQTAAATLETQIANITAATTALNSAVASLTPPSPATPPAAQ